MLNANTMPYVATQQNLAYTLALLRNNDNENYLANLLQLRSVSRAHAAIRAFNIELANIRSNVSNEDLGLLRLQFFRSQFADVLSNPNPNPASPVMDVLAEAVSSYPQVNFDLLYALIDARATDLSYPNFRSLRELQSFGEQTQGPLIHLHALLLGGAPHVENIAKMAGAAVGLSIILRGAPAHAASRLSYMPRNLVERYGVLQSHLISGEGDAVHVFRTVAKRARRCLKVAQIKSSLLPHPVKQAFWPLIMSDIYLRRLRKADEITSCSFKEMNLSKTRNDILFTTVDFCGQGIVEMFNAFISSPIGLLRNIEMMDTTIPILNFSSPILGSRCGLFTELVP